MATTDGILHELRRQLDTFMATYSVTLMKHLVYSESGVMNSNFSPDLPFTATFARLSWMTKTIASKSLSSVVNTLLGWLRDVDRSVGAVSNGKIASWLVASLIVEFIPDTPSSNSSMMDDSIIQAILDRAFQVFTEWNQFEAARAQESSGSFFHFKPTPLKALSPENILQEKAHFKWKQVTACTSLQSLNPIKLRIGPELLKSAKQAVTTRESFLKNFSELRLGLSAAAVASPSNALFLEKLKEASSLLRSIQPAALKPNKGPVRHAALTLLANLLNHELKATNENDLKKLYSVSYGEWSTLISDLHAVSLKMSSKKDYMHTGWKLRIAVLSISTNEIFTRYWKEDAQALLRLHYLHKDVFSLQAIVFFFRNMLRRHFISEKKLPLDSDCMEIINSIQAWCFTLPKQKSLPKFYDQVLPSLLDISIDIAAYNMNYSVQSHLRRLLMEAESIFDERKLVGLEILRVIFDMTLEPQQKLPTIQTVGTGLVIKRLLTPNIFHQLDCTALFDNRSTLGDIIGHVLIECNTHFGTELVSELPPPPPHHQIKTKENNGSTSSVSSSSSSSLSSSSSSNSTQGEYKRSLGIQIFVAAINTLKYLYTSLELNDEQKMIILSRCAINLEESIRKATMTTLKQIVKQRGQAGAIFTGITEYMTRLSDFETRALCILVNILNVLLMEIFESSTSQSLENKKKTWENETEMENSLVQIESICAYLLANEDVPLRLHALETLETVFKARQQIQSTFISVFTIIHQLEPELEAKFLCFKSKKDRQKARKTKNRLGINAGVGVFRFLISEYDSRSSFRWSCCLAILYARICDISPQVTANVWSQINEKACKNEPLIPSIGEIDTTSQTELVHWRNMAVFITSTACPMMQSMSGDGTILGSTSSSSTSPTTQSLSTTNPRIKQQSSRIDRTFSLSSLISPAQVATVLKRLSRFLKSPSYEQRKAAVFALGNTHVTSHSILLDVISKYEPEAFAYEPWNTPEVQAYTVATAGRSNGSNGSSGSSGSGATLGSFGNLTGTSKKATLKAMKAKNQKVLAQLHLQWAMGRVFRMILENFQQKSYTLVHQTPEEKEITVLFHQKACVFVDKLHASLQNACLSGSSIEASTVYFMMQQDFCASIECLLNQHNLRLAFSSSRSGSMTCSNAISPTGSGNLSSDGNSGGNIEPFDLAKRQKWFTTLMDWSNGFGFLANQKLQSLLTLNKVKNTWLKVSDVFGGAGNELLSTITTSSSSSNMSVSGPFSWHWVDEQLENTCGSGSSNNNNKDSTSLLVDQSELSSYQRYFLCQSTFSALGMLLYGPLFNQEELLHKDSILFRWFDECFSVSMFDFYHFKSLQTFARQALKALLQSDSSTKSLSICIEKSFFTQPKGDKTRISHQYFQVLTEIVEEMPMMEDFTAPNVFYRLLHVCLMHLGANGPSDQEEEINDLQQQQMIEETDTKETDKDNNTLQSNTTTAAMSIPNQRTLALRVLKSLIGGFDQFPVHSFRSSEKRLPTMLSHEIANQLQIRVSSFLASKLSNLSYTMSLAILRLLSTSNCHILQQRQMLLVSIPWLSQVELICLNEKDREQLLTVLFRLTTNLNEACYDQLEHIWLSFATSTSTSMSLNRKSICGVPGGIHNSTVSGSFRKMNPINSTSTPTTTVNLNVIMEFLFSQRVTARLATSKLIIWWLCGTEKTTELLFDGILNQVDRLREQQLVQQQQQQQPPATPQTTQPVGIRVLDEMAVAMVLLADVTSHFVVRRNTTYQQFSLKLIHMIFTLVFAFVVDYDKLKISSTRSSKLTTTKGRNFLPWYYNAAIKDEETMYTELLKDCMVVLKNVLYQINTPSELSDPIFDEMNEMTKEIQNTLNRIKVLSNVTGTTTSKEQQEEVDQEQQTEQDQQEDSEEFSSVQSTTTTVVMMIERFELLVQRFASCLTNYEFSYWCQTSIYQFSIETRCLFAIHEQMELRFCLMLYRTVNPEFHGEVFQALMALLHQALDGDSASQKATTVLIQEILSTLTCMTIAMPAGKLILYPQILWVCVALLNHCPIKAFHQPTLLLLDHIMSKKNFFQPTVQDFLICKRPSQWQSSEFGSVLRAILHALGHTNTHEKVMQMIQKVVLLHCGTLAPTREEHLVIITSLLLPYFASALKSSTKQKQDDNSVEDNQNVQAMMTATGSDDAPDSIVKLATDLAYSWQYLNQNVLATVFYEYATGKFHGIKQGSELFIQSVSGSFLNVLSAYDKIQKNRDQQQESPFTCSTGETYRVSLSMEETCFEAISTCFDILLLHLSGGNDEIVATSLAIIEEAIRYMNSTMSKPEFEAVWKSQGNLLVSLMRLVNNPQAATKWQAAVRIFSSVLSSSSGSDSLVATAGNDRTSLTTAQAKQVVVEKIQPVAQQQTKKATGSTTMIPTVVTATSKGNNNDNNSNNNSRARTQSFQFTTKDKSSTQYHPQQQQQDDSVVVQEGEEYEQDYQEEEEEVPQH